LEQPKDACNIRSLYRAGSLNTVSRELVKYEVDLEGVQEVIWDMALNQQHRSEENIKMYLRCIH
jgi:hypothetical protein